MLLTKTATTLWHYICVSILFQTYSNQVFIKWTIYICAHIFFSLKMLISNKFPIHTWNNNSLNGWFLMKNFQRHYQINCLALSFILPYINQKFVSLSLTTINWSFNTYSSSLQFLCLFSKNIACLYIYNVAGRIIWPRIIHNTLHIFSAIYADIKICIHTYVQSHSPRLVSCAHNDENGNSLSYRKLSPCNECDLHFYWNVNIIFDLNLLNVSKKIEY